MNKRRRYLAKRRRAERQRDAFPCRYEFTRVDTGERVSLRGTMMFNSGVQLRTSEGVTFTPFSNKTALYDAEAGNWRIVTLDRAASSGVG